MRIIAGDYKGRVLCSPGDRRVRPTSDKVKEALFSILGYEIIDAVCLFPYNERKLRLQFPQKRLIM